MKKVQHLILFTLALQSKLLSANWAPLDQLPDLDLWLDANDTSSVSHSSGVVSQWNDKSGNGFHLTPSASGTGPTTGTVSLNSLNTIDFDGSNDRMKNDLLPLGSPISIFLVATGSTNGYRRILDGISDGYVFVGNGNSNNNLATFFGAGSWSDVNTNSPTGSLASATLIGLTNDGTTGTPYHNGVAQNTKNGAMGNGTIGLSVGASGGGAQFWDGSVGEVFILNAVLSSASRQKLEGYLANKWGLRGSLASNHPYKSSLPAASPVPVITVDSLANLSPVPVSVTFKTNGTNTPVSGFSSADLNITGGTVSQFSGTGGSGHTYTFKITPSSFPSSVSFFIADGAATTGGGNSVASTYRKVTFRATYLTSFATESLSDVEMWFDASDLNADGTTDSGFSAGNAVNTWSDKSGNGYHLTKQGDPTWEKQNGIGVVNFDGNDAFYSPNYWGGKQEFTLLSISRYTHLTNNNRVIADRTNNNWLFAYHGGNIKRWHFNGWLTNAGGGKDTKFHLHVADMNDNDKGNTFFDGTRAGTINSTGSGGTYLPKQIQFGGWQTGSEYSKCEIAEFIAFDRVLGATDRLALEGYLANKWGIVNQLPTTHSNRDFLAGIGSGLTAQISATSPTQTYPIPVTVSFKKGGSNHSVSNFANDFTTSFKPSTLSGLELWLDASDTSSVSHSSNVVHSWNDKSGKSLQAEQATAGNRPTLVANGQNSLSTIRFDGSNDYISVPSLNITQAYSIFSVAKTTAGSGRDYLFDGVATNAGRSLIALRNAGKVQFWAGNWANSNIASPTGFFTIAAVFDSTSSQLSVNGTTVTGKNTGSYSLTKGIHIGTNYLTNADFLEGDIAEFIIVDGVASTNDRQKIEGYLAHKWTRGCGLDRYDVAD